VYGFIPIGSFCAQTNLFVCLFVHLKLWCCDKSHPRILYHLFSLSLLFVFMFLFFIQNWCPYLPGCHFHITEIKCWLKNTKKSVYSLSRKFCCCDGSLQRRKMIKKRHLDEKQTETEGLSLARFLHWSRPSYFNYLLATNILLTRTLWLFLLLMLMLLLSMLWFRFSPVCQTEVNFTQNYLDVCMGGFIITCLICLHTHKSIIPHH